MTVQDLGTQQQPTRRMADGAARARRRLAVAAVVVLALAALVGLAATSVADATTSAMSNSTAPFQAWQQGFNHGTEHWIGAEVEGPEGWCGSIEQHVRNSGPVDPSAGDGYAVATGGECNEFWSEAFPAGSGPYSPGAGFSTAWPQGGYVTELDVHLDPDHADADGGLVNYFIAISLLDDRGDEPWDFLDDLAPSLRYFAVPVSVDNEVVHVAGHEVTEPGWYTFRHRFSETDDDRLAVDFELSQRGRVLTTLPLTTTALSGEATSSFAATEVGTGYVWLDVAPGVGLPIDEHRVRRGR